LQRNQAEAPCHREKSADFGRRHLLATIRRAFGRIYEVVQVKERDGYYVLPYGQFTMARFHPLSMAEAGYAGGLADRSSTA
jgi:hypothetical protein